VPSVNSALTRARTRLGQRREDVRRELEAPRAGSSEEDAIVARFVAAYESADMAALVELFTDDIFLSMPPMPLEYQGQDAIGAFLRHREDLRGRPLRLLPTRANTQPAFGCYLPDTQATARAHAVFVLTLEGERVSAITWFGDKSLFPRFGLPRSLRG